MTDENLKNVFGQLSTNQPLKKIPVNNNNSAQKKTVQIQSLNNTKANVNKIVAETEQHIKNVNDEVADPNVKKITGPTSDIAMGEPVANPRKYLEYGATETEPKIFLGAKLPEKQLTDSLEIGTDSAVKIKDITDLQDDKASLPVVDMQTSLGGLLGQLRSLMNQINSKQNIVSDIVNSFGQPMKKDDNIKPAPIPVHQRNSDDDPPVINVKKADILNPNNKPNPEDVFGGGKRNSINVKKADILNPNNKPNPEDVFGEGKRNSINVKKADILNPNNKPNPEDIFGGGKRNSVNVKKADILNPNYKQNPEDVFGEGKRNSINVKKADILNPNYKQNPEDVFGEGKRNSINVKKADILNPNYKPSAEDAILEQSKKNINTRRTNIPNPNNLQSTEDTFSGQSTSNIKDHFGAQITSFQANTSSLKKESSTPSVNFEPNLPNILNTNSANKLSASAAFSKSKIKE